MIVDSDRQYFLCSVLTDHVLVELRDDFPGRRDLTEQLLALTPPSLLLFEDRLAEINAFAADVDISGTFDQWADVPVALATERTEGILLGRSSAAASAQFLSTRHKYSFSDSRSDHPVLGSDGSQLNSL